MTTPHLPPSTPPKNPTTTNPTLWIKTPLIKSNALSTAAGCEVFLKLENVQLSGSFKARGIGWLMLESVRRGKEEGRDVHFYCSSGGNGGMAAVVTAVELGCPLTIAVPMTTIPLLVTKLRSLGAHVIQCGTSWKEADTYLRTTLLANDPSGIYISPFDHPDIWDGIGTMIDELTTQLPAYDAICCSVGGGGLLTGIMAGLERNNLRGKVKVLASETVGTDSLYQSVKKGELVTLPGITSIATSLGAARVCEKAFEYAMLETVKSIVVTDAEAAMAAVRFADDERMLVEVACGASLVAVYNGGLRRELGEGLGDEEWGKFRVVIVVCGGNAITLEMLQGYRKKYGREVIEDFKGQVGVVLSAEEVVSALKG